MPLLCVGERRSPSQLDDEGSDEEANVEDKNTSFWQEMPDSILLHIFSFLDVKHLCMIGTVCKSWLRVSADETLWRELFLTQNNLEACHLQPRAVSWQAEVKRLYHNAPVILTEKLTDHTDEVLHVSFSHDGRLFSTTSKDATLKIWEMGSPTTLKYSKDFREILKWDFTQFSCFNESDSMVLVSSVKSTDIMDRHGYMAILSVSEGFRILRVVTMDPSQLFGAWLDDTTFLGGSLEISLDRFATTVQIEAHEVPEIHLPPPPARCPEPVPTVQESQGKPLFTFSSETASLIKFLTVSSALPSKASEQRKTEATSHGHGDKMAYNLSSLETVETNRNESDQSHVHQASGSEFPKCSTDSRTVVNHASCTAISSNLASTATRKDMPMPHMYAQYKESCLSKSQVDMEVDDVSPDFDFGKDNIDESEHKIDDGFSIVTCKLCGRNIAESNDNVDENTRDNIADSTRDYRSESDVCALCYSFVYNKDSTSNTADAEMVEISDCDEKLVDLHSASKDKVCVNRPSGDESRACKSNQAWTVPQSSVGAYADAAKRSTAELENASTATASKVTSCSIAGNTSSSCSPLASTSSGDATLRKKLKNMIFVTGEFAVALHQLGFKNIPSTRRESVLSRGATALDMANMEVYNMVVNYSNNDIHIVQRQDEPDKPDHLIDLYGHVTGLCLTPDQRYLFINCRPWIGKIDRTDPWATPELSPNIEVRIIDLLTLKDIGVKYCGHKGFSPSNMCCFVFLDVSTDYVASGSEDANGYLWDRHYHCLLKMYAHDRGVVNAVAFSPNNQEYLVTASDDKTVKVWRSRSEVKRLGITPLVEEEHLFCNVE